MKIAVLIKHAEDVRGVRIDSATGVPTLAGKAGLDRTDLHAISDAVDLKETCGGHLTAIGVGPAALKDDLVSAMATGADEAVHIVFEGESDTRFVARQLADVLRDGGYDVIIAGKLSEDFGTGQVAQQVAELLGIPHLANVLSADASSGTLHVNYELDGFADELTLPTPVLLVNGSREGEPSRHASLRGMMTARKKTVTQIEAGEPDISPLTWSAPMAARRGGERVIVRDEEPAEAAKKLAAWLREHRLVG